MGRRFLLPAVALLLAGLALAPAASAASVALAVDAAANVSIELRGTVPDGGALRSAMDGDFAPLVDQVTSNATQRTIYLDQIAVAEATPFLNTLFGNHDGTVTLGEVSLFEQLIQQQVQLLPVGSFTSAGTVRLTWDGALPTTAVFHGVTFENAPGPVTSTAPVTVVASANDHFPSSGSTHVLAISANGTTPSAPSLSNATPVVVTMTTPTGVSITSTSGFTSVSITNDPFGWGPASLNGTVDPASSNVGGSVSFGPSFPTGDVLIVLLVVAAGAVPTTILLLRRRRRRTSA